MWRSDFIFLFTITVWYFAIIWADWVTFLTFINNNRRRHFFNMFSKLSEHAHNVHTRGILWSRWLKWVWLIGVANTNSGFIAIIASILHREAKVKQVLLDFYVKTLMQLTVMPNTLHTYIYRSGVFFVLMTDKTDCFTVCACTRVNTIPNQAMSTRLDRDPQCQSRVRVSWL